MCKAAQRETGQRCQAGAYEVRRLLTGVEHMPAIVQDNLIEAFDELQAAAGDRTRLMLGTSTNLYQRVLHGLFSERLFYRMNIIHVDSRPDDGHLGIRLLARPAPLPRWPSDR